MRGMGARALSALRWPLAAMSLATLGGALLSRYCRIECCTPHVWLSVESGIVGITSLGDDDYGWDFEVQENYLGQDWEDWLTFALHVYHRPEEYWRDSYLVFPIWCASVVFGGGSALGLVARRKWLRQPGECARCRHQLDRAEICPECGTPVTTKC